MTVLLVTAEHYDLFISSLQVNLHFLSGTKKPSASEWLQPTMFTSLRQQLTWLRCHVLPFLRVAPAHALSAGCELRAILLGPRMDLHPALDQSPCPVAHISLAR